VICYVCPPIPIKTFNMVQKEQLNEWHVNGFVEDLFFYQRQAFECEFNSTGCND
jgi:hypothetical protein